MKYSASKKNEFEGINEFFNDYKTHKEANKHPKYGKFNDTLLLWGITQATIEQSWKMLMDGILEQRTINTKANSILTMPSIPDFNNYCLGDSAYEEVCKNIYNSINSDENKLEFYKNVIKASNPFYSDFAKKLCALLAVPYGTNLSLWSGGYDLSPFSAKMGKCPLEDTELGKLLDTLPITINWKEEAPLWNIISRTFVQEFKGQNVHVYMRTIDMESVLLRQEIPMLESTNKKIHWHIFYSNGSSFAEVGYNTTNKAPTAINPGENINGFTKDLAFELLAKVLLISQYATNKQAYDTVIGRTLPEYRAPFAYYE